MNHFSKKSNANWKLLSYFKNFFHYTINSYFFNRKSSILGLNEEISVLPNSIKTFWIQYRKESSLSSDVFFARHWNLVSFAKNVSKEKEKTFFSFPTKKITIFTMLFECVRLRSKLLFQWWSNQTRFGKELQSISCSVVGMPMNPLTLIILQSRICISDL